MTAVGRLALGVRQAKELFGDNWKNGVVQGKTTGSTGAGKVSSEFVQWCDGSESSNISSTTLQLDERKKNSDDEEKLLVASAEEKKKYK